MFDSLDCCVCYEKTLNKTENCHHRLCKDCLFALTENPVGELTEITSKIKPVEDWLEQLIDTFFEKSKSTKIAKIKYISPARKEYFKPKWPTNSHQPTRPRILTPFST